MKSAIVFSVLALAGVGKGSSAQAEEIETGFPILQRMIALEDKSYALDFDGPGPSHKRALVRTDYSNVASPSVVSFSIFPQNAQPAGDPALIPARTLDAYRWTIGGESVFAASDWKYPPNGMTAVLRFPIYAFAVEPDGKGVLDSRKLKVDTRIGLKNLLFGGLLPIGALRMGVSGWQPGDEVMTNGLRIGDPPKVIHYDIFALNDVEIELYLTADGKLHRWLYEGEKWRLEKYYAEEVQGPFLVCSEGTAVVAERDGHWCLIGPIDRDEPQVRHIVEKRDNVPLLLIEDRVARTDYFEQKGRMYTADGDVIGTVEAPTDIPTKTRILSDLVRSKRSR